MGITNIVNFIKWPWQIFCEEGKPSFSRVAGAFVIWKIVTLVDNGKVVPDIMGTLFYVLVGYQFLSKALSSLNPAFSGVVLAIAQSKLGITPAPIQAPVINTAIVAPAQPIIPTPPMPV